MEDSWSKINSNILKASEEAVRRRISNKSTKPNTKPWFTEEVKELANEKRKAYLKYRSQSLTLDEDKAIRNSVNNKIQYIKRAHWESFSSDIEHDLYGGQNKIWNMLRNRKKPINEHIYHKNSTQ